MKNYNKRYITTDNKYKSRFVLTQQGEDYFRKYFPITNNDTIAKELGCARRTVLTFAQKLGLKKDAAYISQCCRNAAKCLSPQQFEAFQAASREFKKTERFKQMMKQISEKYRRTKRMEYIRLLNGEEQKTKIRFREPYSEKRKWYRHALKTRHYIPETAKTSLVFYYTDDTKRNNEVEATASKFGFTFHTFR